MAQYPYHMTTPLVCDMTFPQAPAGPLLTPDFEAAMDEHLKHGVTFTSVTIASDEATVEGTVRWLGASRRHILARPEKYVLVDSGEDIERARRAGKMGINFHFQGTNSLLGDLSLVELYRKLGVGHMLLAYNARNLVGDGCHEESDVGLSRFGKALIAEMNRVGMMVDVTHTGYRTSMDAIAASSQPVVFTHSNSKAIFDHQRNITDDQAKACAATGGVIGINGVGLFLSAARHDKSPQIIATHVDYFANLVGPEHVGFGLDSVFNIPHFLSTFAANNADKYAVGGYLTSKTPAFAGPDVIPAVAAVLAGKGWQEKELRGLLGENWLRVMTQAWSSRTAAGA
jgi:membrane dipeptidase